MVVYGFEPLGFDGELVSVEVDLRRGIPAVDIVGLADGAVREARERIRAAVRNAGFAFPLDRLLISLAPAAVRKGGSSFDLSMALSILAASGQIPDFGRPVLALGELELSGRVRPVSGVLPAVASAARAGVGCFVVPPANLAEARVIGGIRAFSLPNLALAPRLAAAVRGDGSRECFWSTDGREGPATETPVSAGLDMADVRGHGPLKRALEIAAAGGHHVLLFGPPGGGKTMAARRLPGLLPPLDDDEAITTTKIHSLAGLLPRASGLLRDPPFRAPHHGASAEGVVGGGKNQRPGEISLAHGGVLFLDEAPEFRSDVLQALREPLEEGSISIARADRVSRFPSRFTLILACNPCPCGNLGRPGAVCLCSGDEIRRYWKRLGGPLLDRIDIRVPVRPVDPAALGAAAGESSAAIRARVIRARQAQRARLAPFNESLNARLPAAGIDACCGLEAEAQRLFVEGAQKAGLSSRACHGVLRVARTIADLDGAALIGAEALLEALGLRQHGDGDYYWQLP